MEHFAQYTPLDLRFGKPLLYPAELRNRPRAMEHGVFHCARGTAGDAPTPFDGQKTVPLGSCCATAWSMSSMSATFRYRVHSRSRMSAIDAAARRFVLKGVAETFAR